MMERAFFIPVIVVLLQWIQCHYEAKKFFKKYSGNLLADKRTDGKNDGIGT